MAIKIALAGNPNCGKTTMFNSLTGANQYVGNWPGVTVEKKEQSRAHNRPVADAFGRRNTDRAAQLFRCNFDFFHAVPFY